MPEDPEQFRAELTAWLDANFTDEVKKSLEGRGTDESFDAHRKWNATLVDAGYGAIAWPAEYGGHDAGIRHQLVYNEEMARAGAPGPVNAIGVANIAPAIMAIGTDEQKERFLQPMLRGDEIWSQGMSEPEAGSDLASLRCRAVLDGDHFVVNGQKTWNSNGDRADWCQLYVRTDPDAPKHKGITCLLVDMTHPRRRGPHDPHHGGRPRLQRAVLHRRPHPDLRAARRGERGLVGGDQHAEQRAGRRRQHVPEHPIDVRPTSSKLRSRPRSDGTRPIDSPVVRDQLMARFAEVRNLEFLAKRMLGAAISGKAPGAEGSVIKLAWSLTSQSLPGRPSTSWASTP